MAVLALPGIADDDALERAISMKRSLASMEAEQYLYVLEFLDECAADPQVLRLCGAERIHPYGGDGTPDIPEFAVCEIAASLGISKSQVENFLKLLMKKYETDSLLMLKNIAQRVLSRRNS